MCITICTHGYGWVWVGYIAISVASRAQVVYHLTAAISNASEAVYSDGLAKRTAGTQQQK